MRNTACWSKSQVQLSFLLIYNHHNRWLDAPKPKHGCYSYSRRAEIWEGMGLNRRFLFVLILIRLLSRYTCIFFACLSFSATFSNFVKLKSKDQGNSSKSCRLGNYQEQEMPNIEKQYCGRCHLSTNSTPCAMINSKFRRYLQGTSCSPKLAPNGSAAGIFIFS